MFKKGSKIYSVLKVKCPRCHEGDLFEEKNPYVLSKSLRMHTHCPACGFRYEVETGFFYGSMYVSYGLSIAFSIAFLALYYLLSALFLFEFDWIQWLIIDAVLLLLLMPVMFRFSRAVWLITFVQYDPEAKSRHDGSLHS